MMRSHPTKAQRGVALITAILLVAIATVLAAKLTWDNQVSIRRTETSLALEQARFFALGAEAAAIEILREDDNAYDNKQEEWNQVVPPVSVGYDDVILGQMQGTVTDAQGKLNINNLMPDPAGNPDPVSVEIFERLFQYLDIDTALVDLIIDWIDADTVPQPRGAEDGIYTGLDPGYRPANGYFTTLTELRAVAGVDAETYALLEPHLTAIPAGRCGGTAGITGVNMNFATPEVMAALHVDISPNQAQSWAEERDNSGWEDITEIINLPADIAGSYAIVSSPCLRLDVTVDVGSTVLTMYSLLDRSGGNGNIVPFVRAYGLD